MAQIRWSRKQRDAAMQLAQGYTIAEVSESMDIPVRTLYNWRGNVEYAKEVDRLSNMIETANRAERLRITHRMARQLMKKENPTQKDLLEWLKFAQSETDGIKLDLTALLDNDTSMAGGGSE